jgi:hypothetical protein
MIAFMALVQPCPAPFVVVPIVEAAVAAGLDVTAATTAAGIADGASALADNGALTGAGIVGQLGKAGGAVAAQGIGKRHPSPFNSRATTDPFPACMSDVTLGDPHIRITVGTDTIKVDGNAENWAIFNGAPASCMAQVDSYNAHPNISDLNHIHGGATVINTTSFLMYGMPQSVFGKLQSMVKA